MTKSNQARCDFGADGKLPHHPQSSAPPPGRPARRQADGTLRCAVAGRTFAGHSRPCSQHRAHSPSPGPQACVHSQGQAARRTGASAEASVQAVSVTSYLFFIPAAPALPMPVAGGPQAPGLCRQMPCRRPADGPEPVSKEQQPPLP